jgi:hypothetical protein
MTSREIATGRGIVPVSYVTGQGCPCCTGKHWHVGRMTAECGRCGFAVPLANAEMSGGTHSGKRYVG